MLTIGRVGNPVKAVLEAHKNTYSDLRIAQAATVTEMVKWLKTGKMEPEELSVKAIWEALVAESNPHLDPRFSDFQEIREAITSSQFPKLTGALIHGTLMRQYEFNVGDLMSLVSERESTNREETYAGTTPGERGSHVEEGAPFSTIQIGEKFFQIANKKFGKGVELTREMLIFDKTGDVLKRARDNGTFLGFSLASFICYRLTDTVYPEVDHAGTSQAYIINGTRRAMYADTHAAWDTYANDNVYAASLPSISVVRGMRKLSKGMKDENGDRIVATTPVVFGTDLIEDELRTFFEAQDFDVNSANKDKNIYKGKSRVVTSAFFPSDTRWYMGDPQRQCILQWVWPPSTEVGDGDPQRQIVAAWWSSYMCGLGNEDYRFVVENQYAG